LTGARVHIVCPVDVPSVDVPPVDVVSQHDPVNAPAHYRAHPFGVECIAVVEHMTFNLGNAVKYIWRHGLKPGADALEDLKKSRWYLDREIARLEKGKP